jgi:hypothetical protein
MAKLHNALPNNLWQYKSATQVQLHAYAIARSTKKLQGVIIGICCFFYTAMLL